MRERPPDDPNEAPNDLRMASERRQTTPNEPRTTPERSRTTPGKSYLLRASIKFKEFGERTNEETSDYLEKIKTLQKTNNLQNIFKKWLNIFEDQLGSEKHN